MEWLALIGMAALLCFGFVLLFGAPYVPTLKPQVRAAIELTNLKPGQTLIELGCGDGKVLIAALQTGVHVVGYELNPILAVICWLRTRRFKGNAKIICGNFWTADWPQADALFTFLHPRFMRKLDKKIVQYNCKPVKLTSFAFEIPNRKPKQVKQGVYLYEYL